MKHVQKWLRHDWRLCRNRITYQIHERRKDDAKRIVSLIFGLIGIGVGMAVMPPFWLAIGFNNTWLTSPLINAIIGAIIFLILGEMASGWILKQLKRAETFLTKQSPSYLLFGSISTIIGLVLAAILSLPLYSLPIPGLNVILPIVLMLILVT